jgi:hypothetical protein
LADGRVLMERAGHGVSKAFDPRDQHFEIPEP